MRISPAGERVWAIRTMVRGSRQRHTLGAYPTVSLTEARSRARNYGSAAREGTTPEELDAQLRAQKLTIKEAHGDYISAVAKSIRPQTKKLKEGMYSDHIDPEIGSRLLSSIRGADVTEVVAAVVAKGFPVQANRVYSELMAFLRWCEEKHLIPGVPSKRKKQLRALGAAKETPRRRTLTDTEIPALWRLVEDMGSLTRDYSRLMLLTAQRPAEVRLISWPEVDLTQKLWIIPGARYKTGLDHAVPLSDEAIKILKARWSIGAKGYILAGREPGQAFNGHASAMGRIRKKIGGRADFTWHDMRRTARSGLSRLGVDERTAELVIGHVPDGMVKVYDMHERLSERRAALDAWAKFVVSLCEGASSETQIKSA